MKSWILKEPNLESPLAFNYYVMKKLSLLAIFLSVLIMGCSASTSESGTINEGETAPDFTYTSLENEQVTLSGLQGSVVYIFFFGANCPHCRSNGPVTENEIYQKFKDNPDFMAIGLDTWNTSAGSVTNFKNTTGISYTLLLNARQSLIDYYGNTSDYDRSVVIASDGTIAYQGTQFVNKDTEAVTNVIEKELSKL